MTNVTYDSVESQASYGIGLEMGVQIRNGGLLEYLVPDAIVEGIKDALGGKTPAVEINAIHNALRELQQRLEPIQQNMIQEAVTKGRQFLEENAKRPEVVVTESGLQYQIVNKGTGQCPTINDKVKVHYTGKTTEGVVFDSTEVRGEPIDFIINSSVKGMQEALLLMPVGSKWQLYIPPHIGYGDQNGGKLLPPQSTLVFDIELIEIL